MFTFIANFGAGRSVSLPDNTSSLCNLLENPLCEVEEYRVEVCMILHKLLKLDKDDFTEDERADAEEVKTNRMLVF